DVRLRAERPRHRRVGLEPQPLDVERMRARARDPHARRLDPALTVLLLLGDQADVVERCAVERLHRLGLHSIGSLSNVSAQTRQMPPRLPPGSPALLRRLNAAAALHAIRTDGPASRADLARSTGLSNPTVNGAAVSAAAVGGGAPGEVEPMSGQLTLAPQLAGWGGRQLAARLEPVFRCPVLVDNEGRLSLLAEQLEGAALGVEHAFLVQIGVGI